jgi:predicted dehydrogenase
MPRRGHPYGQFRNIAMLNAAIVGLGRWGQNLVDSVQAAGKPKGRQIRFTRAVTRTPSKVADFAARHRMPVDSDYAAALADPDIDAIALATPHTQHADQITAAAAAGKHFTLTRESAQAAVDACDRAGVVVALGHNRRFLPSMMALKRDITDGVLGQVLHLESQFSASFGLDLTPAIWRADPRESPAGGMTSLGIHSVDAFIHLNGPIASVQALSLRQATRVDANDTSVMLFRFANGCTGYLGSLTATARIWRVEVYGTKGWARLNEDGTMDTCAVNEKPQTRSFQPSDTLRAELEAFAAAVAGRSPYPLPPDQAIHGVAVLEAVARSAAQDGAAVGVE